MVSRIPWRYGAYYVPARLSRSWLHNYFKAVPLVFSTQGRGIVRDWWKARSIIKKLPRDEVRAQIKTLDLNHDAVACSIYHNITGIPIKRIAESGALDLMQIFYGHIFKIDNYLDRHPRPDLSRSENRRFVDENYLQPARAIIERKLAGLVETGLIPPKSRDVLIKMFDKFNRVAYDSLQGYQKKRNPSLSDTLAHRYQTVGLMARYGVKLMDVCLERNASESRVFQTAFFNAVMAAQIHDDLTDVRLDELAHTNENLVHAFLRHHGEYESAKPFFKIMTPGVLKRVAPKSFVEIRKFEEKHLKKISLGPKFDILRRFPSVF